MYKGYLLIYFKGYEIFGTPYTSLDSADPDEMSHTEAFHLGLSLFAKVRVKDTSVYRGLIL